MSNEYIYVVPQVCNLSPYSLGLCQRCGRLDAYIRCERFVVDVGCAASGPEPARLCVTCSYQCRKGSHLTDDEDFHAYDRSLPEGVAYSVGDWMLEEAREWVGADTDEERVDACLDLIGVCLIGLVPYHVDAVYLQAWWMKHQGSRNRPMLYSLAALSSLIASHDKGACIQALIAKSIKMAAKSIQMDPGGVHGSAEEIVAEDTVVEHLVDAFCDRAQSALLEALESIPTVARRG